MIVRKLRLQRGWTQEHLASLTGLSVRSIQRIERGQGCSIETLNSLAAVFEVDRTIFEIGENAMSTNTESPLTSDEKAVIGYVKGIKEFYGHLVMYAIFVAVFGLFFGFRHPLIFWGSIGGGIGILLHGLNAFEVINFFGPKWEKRQIEKRLRRPL